MTRQQAGPVPMSNGQSMRCLMCGWTQFETRFWKLNTAGMEFMNLAWLNKDACCVVCQRCRYIHWFDLRLAERDRED
jgi:hypothetical protein